MMDRPFLVGIVGGSASGKTCLSDHLLQHYGAETACLISEDDYYVDAGGMPEFDPAHFNFDEPAAKDHDLLLTHLARLRAGEAIQCPTYDFATHRRKKMRKPCAPAKIVIVEGLHLFTRGDLAAMFDLRVYVSAGESARLARRLERDTRERGRSESSVRAQFSATVQPMHALHVEPQKNSAHLILDNSGRPDFGRLVHAVVEAVKTRPKRA
jgi:uridine kinase